MSIVIGPISTEGDDSGNNLHNAISRRQQRSRKNLNLMLAVTVHKANNNNHNQGGSLFKWNFLDLHGD